jgi:3-mercaptopyruvate sulfurtransferase SseA
MWQACNITPDQHVAFYCGTGWRASLAFMCAAQWAGRASPFTMAAG